MTRRIRLSNIDWDRGEYKFNTDTASKALDSWGVYLKEWIEYQHGTNTKVSGDPLPSSYSRGYEKAKAMRKYGNPSLSLTPDLNMTGRTHKDAVTGTFNEVDRQVVVYYKLSASGKRKYRRLQRAFGHKWETFNKGFDKTAWSSDLYPRMISLIKRTGSLIKRV